MEENFRVEDGNLYEDRFNMTLGKPKRGLVIATNKSISKSEMASLCAVEGEWERKNAWKE